MSSEAEERLSALWREHGTRVLGYATRHVGPHEAEEVAAETFVVAWRRIDEVPEQAPVAWLLVVARHIVARRHRSMRRRRAAERELRASVEAQASAASAEASALERIELVRALWRLGVAEREALLLVAWDGLSLAEGARVAGCSVSAFTMRVSRARRHLLAEMQATSDPPGRGSEPGSDSRAGADVRGSGRRG